jgi:hypothetical protein
VLLQDGDLVARSILEDALSKPSRFSQLDDVRYDSPDQPLNKAFATVMRLRKLARDVVQPNDDLRGYYIGLLYMTLNMTRWYRLPRVSQMHALYAAGLLCEKLGLEPT